MKGEQKCIHVVFLSHRKTFALTRIVFSYFNSLGKTFDPIRRTENKRIKKALKYAFHFCRGNFVSGKKEG